MAEKIKKTKLSEVASDLGVSNTEVVTLLKEYTGPTSRKKGSPVNASTMLIDEEINYFLEYLTQKNEVDSFDDYFNSVTVLPKPKKEAPKTSVKTKKAEEIHSKFLKNQEKEKEELERKKAAEAEKLRLRKLEEKKRRIAARKAAELQKLAEQKAAQENAEVLKTQNESPAAPVVNKSPMSKFPNATKIGTSSRPVASRPAASRPLPGRSIFDRNKTEGGNTGKTPVVGTPVPKKPKKEPKGPPKAPVKARERGEKITVNIDVASDIDKNAGQHKTFTRGSYVELDKFNTRYEDIAERATGKKDFINKKQKITRKSDIRNKERYSSKRRSETEADKMKRLQLEKARKQQLKVLIPENITVSELAIRLKANASKVIGGLMKLGIMATINEVIDYDTAALVAIEMGAKVKKEVTVTIEERIIDTTEDSESNLVQRDPVVVVMGHVDHGKTSLLDKIRHANVVAGEAGGITQHIGAYKVAAGNKSITFLDTPGHAAFTSMRARGASVTDIAILVVAADDGIMPQTIEAINHAKAAEVSIIVAINKIDKPGANPDKIKQELTEHGLLIEEWGGDIICSEVSAKTGQGIDDLLENILLIAEVKEYKANPDRRAKGAVIEARLDKGLGPVATVLVQNGTLNTGDIIIAGSAVGHIRVMTDDKGNVIKSAGPSTPVSITGLADVPSAGDVFDCVEDERLARELALERSFGAKQEKWGAEQKVTLENIFSKIAEGDIKELKIIVKADVQGSAEAVKQSLEKLSTKDSEEEIRVKVIHSGVGAVSESDVMLASASNAIIVGFNVRPMPSAEEMAKRDGVDMRMYRIIYDATEEIESAMKGMLAPKFRETVLGKANIRQVMKITGAGTIAGSYVSDGKITRNAEVRVVRDGIVIAEDKIVSLRRFKDDVKEVSSGFECGIGLEKFADLKEGDVFEVYIIEEIKQPV
ncbi:MAG: translation initiation factor IF-2 [Ruminococcus sp.]|jgi:translation initiation factor IF-2|nr:translation initiation factor IF-2 [Ruminococcus sp.]